MRSIHFVLAGMLASSAAFVACSSDNGTVPPGGDGGLSDSDASTSDGGDAGATDAGGDASDPDADAAAREFACDPAERIDERGISDYGIAAAAFGDKWVVDWIQAPLASPDSKAHLKARVFDGTALGTEAELATFESLGSGKATVTRAALSADGTGHAFAQWWGGTSAGHAVNRRSVFDFTAGTFGSPTDFRVDDGISIDGAYAVAGLPGGGALSVYRGGEESVTVDRYKDGAWSAAATLSTGALPARVRVAVNPNGKAGAYWAIPLGGDVVSTFDGNTFAMPVGFARTTPQVGIAVAANGDILLARTRSSTEVFVQRFRASTQAFDAEESLVTGGIQVSAVDPQIVVDANDNVTVAWREDKKIRARRKVGGTWSAVAEMGAGLSVSLTLDADGNVFALPADSAAGVRVLRAGPTDTTWSETPTGLMGRALGLDMNTQGAVGFDTKKRLHVFVSEDLMDTGTIQLMHTVCY